MNLDNQEMRDSGERSCTAQLGQRYFSFAELAERWRCSRATVYNRLRGVGAQVLDFAAPGKKGKKVIPVRAVLQIEEKRMRRLR
jgi:hypothetical protein